MFAALAWMAKHASEYRFDCDRFGITGASAGGHLTALIDLKATKQANLPYTMRCMAPVCPPTDFTTFVRDSPPIRPTIEALVGGVLEDHAAQVRDVSPLHHVHKSAPPCLVTHGGADTVVPSTQATMFVDALKAVGVEADVLIVPGVDHAAFTPGIEPLEPLGGLDAFRAFYTKHLLS
jgi:acetyl esterase/lipase